LDLNAAGEGHLAGPPLARLLVRDERPAELTAVLGAGRRGAEHSTEGDE
jgi:hypothetical protein